MKTEWMSTEDEDTLEKARRIIRAGGVVAFPTDTVYGMGAEFTNAGAVLKLYTAKRRPEDRAIPILVADEQMLSLVTTGMSKFAWKLAEAFWPGPLTLVVPRHPDIPDALSIYPTVAVRVPDLDFTCSLLEACGPLAVTSANLSCCRSPRTVQEVQEDLSGRVDLILDGGSTPGGYSFNGRGVQRPAACAAGRSHF